MTVRSGFKVIKRSALAATAAGGIFFGWGQTFAADPVPVSADDGAQVLTRGPIHEAFAETITFNPTAGIIVPKGPPAAIDEMPPDQRPEGTNVSWIPGYWAWDDERTDFLWVSGTWRALPPGREWMPGYWGQVAQGFQWTSGYWADAKTTEVEYLPEPPASVEAGPNVAAPAADQGWIPGCWAWRNARYTWRPGYWTTVQADWTWIPDHYVWTPRGYLFVDGYWDYSVARRGALFAPVYFAAGVYTRRGFYYSPQTLINPGVFANQLFLRPGYQHYYFGDYYAANYATAGFYPWFSYNGSRYGYDPFCAQQRWQHRDDRNWQQGLQAEFQNRRDHEEARPPRTWTGQQALIAREANSKQKSFVVAASLDQVARSTASPLKFQPVDKQQRQRITTEGQAVQTFRQERQKLETVSAAASASRPGEPAVKQTGPVRVKRPASPIVGSTPVQPGATRPDTGRPDNDSVPPKRPGGLPPPGDASPSPKGNRPPAVDRPEAKPLPETKPRPEEKPRRDEKPRPQAPKNLPADTVRPQPGAKPLPKVDRLPPLQPQKPQPLSRTGDKQPEPGGNQPEPPATKAPIKTLPKAAPRDPNPAPATAVPPDAGRKAPPQREQRDPPRRESNDPPQRDTNDKPMGDVKEKLKK
ncbi:MAG: hypothetical protein K8T25_19810 [Planctomycetia bacterium]|nr:hypothetical protein [Planctomycetia bacterium]